MGGMPWRHEARQIETDSLNEQPSTFSEDESQTNVKSGTSWGWTLEILSIIGSVGWMTGVVAILIKMRDRPHSDWTFFLSLSATLAIFATAAKLTASIAVSACISQYKWIHFKKAPRRLVDLDLYDSASRGPLGSLILICRRPKGLATVGALVTLLALALDVFVQQVIKLDDIEVREPDGNAVLGVVRNWNGTTTLPAAGITSVASLFTVTNAESDIAMQGAVYRGVYNLENPPVFRCNASRCEWDDPVVSLGFKATCEDVTEAAFRTINPARFSSLSAKGDNITTPGGIVLRASYVPTDSQTVVTVGAKSLLKSALVDINTTYVDPDIARIAVFRSVTDRTNMVIHLNQSEVVECHLGLVAYRYSNVSASGGQLTVLKNETIPLERGLAQEDSRFPLRPGGTFRIYDAVEFSQEGLPLMRASLAELRALTLLFNSTRFAGSILYGLSTEGPPTGMGDAFKVGNISQILENMAVSMTAQLRSNYSMVAEGVRVDRAVFVHVRWEWLTLPMIVELASIAFVLMVLVKSKEAKDVQLWKSSAVAILSHGMSFQSGGRGSVIGTMGSSVQSPSELEKMAKKLKVKLG